MYLSGWKYEGRKISDQLHEQMLVIMEMMNDPNIVRDMNWPALQKVIALELGVAPGQVRTIKSTMEVLGILKKGSLNANDIPSSNTIYTKDGRTLVELIATEQMLKDNISHNSFKAIESIQNIYRLFYQSMLVKYSFNMGGNILHPLVATLKALKKYESLDFWEWYILNSCIRNDANEKEEEELDRLINEYRTGKIRFKEGDVIENQLSHSYVLGNFIYTGLITAEGSKYKLKIRINEGEKETINDILADQKIDVSYESLIENAGINVFEDIWESTYDDNSAHKRIKSNPIAELIALFENIELIDAFEYSEKYEEANIRVALKALEEKRKIFKYADNKYINVLRLEKNGIGEEQIKDFCKRIYEYGRAMHYFSPLLVERANVCPEIADIGFGEMFYCSLLKSDSRLSRKQIGDTYIFSTDKDSITIIDIISDYVQEVTYASVDEIVAKMSEKYGIQMSRTSVIARVKESQLYHDKILDYIYKDYETYYQDV